MKTLLLFTLACVSAFSQVELQWTYRAGATCTAATTCKVTIQLATSATKNARLKRVSVTESSATDATIAVIRGGTVATGTTPVTSYRMRTDSPASPDATIYTVSNSTGGTTLPSESLGGANRTFDVSDYEIKPGEVISLLITAGSSNNHTVNVTYEEYYPR